MSDTAVLRVKIDASGAVVGGREVEGALHRMDGAAAGSARGLSGVGVSAAQVSTVLRTMAGSAIGVAAINFLKSSAQAAMEAEVNFTRLAAAVERRGAAFGVTANQLSALATELERVTVFEDDAIQQAQAILLRFDEIDSSNIRAVTAATLDFAQATGQDAASAATAFGKALLVPGEAMRALKEVGITLTQDQQDMVDAWNASGESAKSVALLVGLMNDKIGGEAESAAKTGAGGVKQFTAALGNLKELIGSGLIPDLSGLTNLLRGIVTVFSSGKFSVKDILNPFSGLSQALHDAHEAQLAADALGLSLKLAGDNGRHMKDSQPWVKPQTKAEIDAARKAAEELAAKIKALTDRLDPAGAESRALAADTAILSQAIADGKIAGDQAILTWGNLTGEWTNARTVVADLNFELLSVLSTQERLAQIVGTGATDGTGVPNGSQARGSVTRRETWTEAERYADEFTTNLSNGMGDAAASFAREFIETGELNVKRLGDMLLDVLLDAAQQYFAQMLANQAKLKMTSGGGGSGGTGGMGSAMGALGNVAIAAAVVYAVVEITKGIKAANDAGKFKETAAAGVYRGGVGSTYAGELSEQGRQMAGALRDFLNLMQETAGSWITEMGEIGVRVSGDGKKFQAMVGGEIVGVFSSMSEAMVRAFQASFSEATFASEINPIIRDMVTNFRGTDINELKAGLQQVKSMLDEVSGLSDVEIAIKDLPFKADALRQSMVQLGASFTDASALAARWQATQMQGLRDQITGHEASAAEQRAQKEREALLFNAQLALNKAEIQMKRDKLAADIEILKAGGSLDMADLNLTTQYLGQYGRLVDVKAQLANQDLQIQQGHVNLMTAAGQAALAALQIQLDALNEVYAILDSIKPINLAEIRIPNVGGGGGGVGNIDTGPSEAEQRAIDFNEFLRTQALDALPDLLRRMADLNAAFDAQAQAASEVEGGEERLAAARHAALARLTEDAIDSLGMPLESLRDRLVDLRNVLEFIRTTLDRTMEGFARFDQVLEEMRAQVGVEMLGLAAEIADAFGMDKEAAEFRQQIAEMELRLKVIQLHLLYEEYQALGLISEVLAQQFKALFDFIDDPANWPDFSVPEPPTTTQSGGSGGSDPYEDARKRREQALISALDRLRGSLDRYRDFMEQTSIGELSGRTLQQRSADALALYQQQLALAQAGNLDAITQGLPDAANQALELLGQYLDPSSAQYQAILAQMRLEMSGIQGGIEGILNGAHNPNAEVVTELQSIAEILNAIRDLWGQSVAWNPGAGAGTILPGPGTQGNPNAAGAHPGLVNYGDFWGWHPLGWSPPGGWNHGAGSTHSSSSGVVQVQDAGAHAALAKVEAKLLRIEAAQVNDTNKAESARRRQDPRSAKRVGGSYRDEVAS